MKNKCSCSSICKSLIWDCSMKGFLIELMEVIHVESSLYRILKISKQITLREICIILHIIFRATWSPCCNNLCIAQQERVQGTSTHREQSCWIPIPEGGEGLSVPARAQSCPMGTCPGGSQPVLCSWAHTAQLLLLLFALRVGFLTPGPCLSCQSKPANWEMPPSFCLLSLNCWDWILKEKHRWPLQNVLWAKY